MDVSELKLIRKFAEAQEKIDFDVLIKQLLTCEASPELDNQTTGQKRKQNLKSVKQTITTTNTKSKQDKGETNVEILYEEHSKSCQTNLFVNGTVVSEWPDSSLELKAGLSRYDKALKTYGNRSKRYGVNFTKINKNTGLQAFEVEKVSMESSSQMEKLPEHNKSIPANHFSDSLESNQNEHLKGLREQVSEDLTGQNCNIATYNSTSTSIELENLETSITNNEDNASTSKIPRLSISRDEIGEANQDKSPLQDYRQSICEEAPESFRNNSNETMHMFARPSENPSHMNDSCIASTRRKEATDAKSVATEIPLIPQCDRNSCKEKENAHEPEVPLKDANSFPSRHKSASSDEDFNECNKKHQDGTERYCITKEGDELKNNRVAAEDLEETANKNFVATDTQHFRDIAFPNSLCYILYEELLGQDRTKLENLASTLEQAQNKCYTMVPRTTEERQGLLESQRQARRERNLNARNDRLDYLKQHSFDIIMRFLEIKVQETVKFAKCIPGFKTLDIDDQITLIKDVNLANIRPHVCRCINSETQLVTFMPGLHIGFEEICEVFTEGMREQMEMSEAKSNKINITAREEAVVQAVLIMSAGRNHHLKNLEKIEEIYRNLVSCLLHVVSLESKPVFERMDELSDLILFCRHLKEHHHKFMLLEILQQSSKHGDNQFLHELFYP